MPKVFLSYTHSDRRFVDKIAKDLIRTGIDVFLDKQEILPGDSIVDKIDEALGTSDFLLVAISHQSVKSKWVRHELNSALMRELDRKLITVIPLRVDDADVPSVLLDRKYLDFRHNYRQSFNELVAALLKRRQLEKGIVPVITYNPAHGHTRELSRDSFTFAGNTEFIEGIFLPWGLSRVELILSSPPGEDGDTLYEYFYEKYETNKLRVAPRVSVLALTGLETAKWRVVVDGVADIHATALRQLLTKILIAHNQQIQSVMSLFMMRDAFVSQSPLSRKITMPALDGPAFLKSVAEDEDIGRLMNKTELKAFTDEMSAAMARAEGVEVDLEGFGGAFPVIVLIAYLTAKYPEKALAYTRIITGLTEGKNPLAESEKQMLPMLEFYVMASQEGLRELWAEYKIEHLEPEETDLLEKFFSKHGMAGAIHEHGGVVGLFRLAATSNFDTYRIILAALNRLTRFIHEGAQGGLWGDEITPNMMASGRFWLYDGVGELVGV